MDDAQLEIWKRAWFYVATMRSALALADEEDGEKGRPDHRIVEEVRHLPGRLRARVLLRLRLSSALPGAPGGPARS